MYIFFRLRLILAARLFLSLADTPSVGGGRESWSYECVRMGCGCGLNYLMRVMNFFFLGMQLGEACKANSLPYRSITDAS